MEDKKHNYGRTKLSGMGVFISLVWLFLAVTQDKPGLVALIGVINFLLMTFTRVQARRKDQFELEGGIMGFLIVWVIVFLVYKNKEAVLMQSLTIREFLVFILAVSFLVWFLISPRKTTQELVFGLPAFYSRLLLNLWKLAVIFLLVVNLEELKFLNEVGVVFFVSIGYFDIILFYYKSLKVNYLDIILNPLSIVNSVLLSVIVESSKWIILTTVFIVVGQITLDFWSFLLIFLAILLILVSFTTNIGRLSIVSGVFEKKVDESRKVVPQIFNEVLELASSKETISSFNDFYEVIEPIKIKKKTKVSMLEPKEYIIKFPFSEGLTKETGVFFIHFNMRSFIKKGETRKRNRKNEKKSIRTISVAYGTRGYKNVEKDSDVNLLVKRGSIHRLPIAKWEALTPKLKHLSRDEFCSKIGIEPEELEKELAKVIRGSVIVQEQLRCRIKGLPAPSFNKTQKINAILEGNKLVLPEEFLKRLPVKENQEIELIEGKDEYLFYAKVKRKI